MSPSKGFDCIHFLHYSVVHYNHHDYMASSEVTLGKSESEIRFVELIVHTMQKKSTQGSSNGLVRKSA